MEHTREPWSVYDVDGAHGIMDNDGVLVAEMWQRKELWSIANARRIVVCVNACEGIPTEALENDTWDTILDTTVISVTKGKIDSLKARVKEMEEAINTSLDLIAQNRTGQLVVVLMEALKGSTND